MFTRARIFANLTPFERAALKLIEGILLAAVVAGVQAASPFLATSTLSASDLGAALHTFVVAAVAAVLASALKYARAFGDPPLPPQNPPAAPFVPAAPPASDPPPLGTTRGDCASLVSGASLRSPATPTAPPPAEAA